MKKSKYNIFTKNGNGEILIYNTLSNRYVKIIGKKADRIYQELLDEQEMDDLEGLKCLQKYGIIVDNDYNEKIIAESRFMNLVYSGETLDITVIPTEDCNFRCIYCYESSEQNYMDKETQSNILKWFRKNLKGYKHLIISWFGGEPLLVSETILFMMEKIKGLCREYGVTYRANMTSNGYLLDEQLFRKLVGAGIRYYQITLDGPKDLHDWQRPHKYKGNSYEQILSNLKEIKEKCGNLRFEIKIRINISKAVDLRKTEFLDMVEKEFIGSSQFKLDFEWIRNWGGRLEEEDNISTSPEIVTGWIQEATKRKLICNDFLNGSCGMFFCEACKKNGFIINFDGTIHKCTLAIYNTEYKDINQIGKIMPGGKMEINEKKEVCWLGKNIYNNHKCDNCEVYPLCMSINCPWMTQIKKKEICMPLKNLFREYLLTLDFSKRFETIV